MNFEELRSEILPRLEKIIEFSLINNLDLHTSVGGRLWRTLGSLQVVEARTKNWPKSYI